MTEDAGPATSADAPASRGRRWPEWPIGVVVAAIVTGLVVVAAGHFRRGAVVLSFGVALALFLRLLLPDADAGMLRTRSKRVDVACLAVLAVAVGVLSLWVPPPST